jgi:copper(I)-binding protein
MVAALSGVSRARAHEYYLLHFKLIHPWSVPTAPGDVDAPVYFSAEEIEQPDRLVWAQSPMAEAVEFRTGMSGSVVVSSLEIPKQTRVEFLPGGSHLLLKSLKVPMQTGRSYMLFLGFEKSGRVPVQISIGPH